MKNLGIAQTVEVLAPVTPEQAQILTPEALEFFGKLHREFNARRLDLLEMRKGRQEKLDQGVMPDFLPETKWIRESSWQVLPVADDLQNRRVEITGPVDRKMV